MRILAIDPGLTRCGVGILNKDSSGLSLVKVRVLKSLPDLGLTRRYGEITRGIAQLIDEFRPEILAVEKIFANHNLHSVMNVAGLIGIIHLLAYERGLPLAMHTPSEVKASVCGFGDASKVQVQRMIKRLLGLDGLVHPADAADALALAVCCARKSLGAISNFKDITSAQKAWQAALRGAGPLK